VETPSTFAPATKSAETLTRESLKSVPDELLSQIHEATVNADLDRLLQLIDQVNNYNVETAKQLRRFAEQFDYQNLLNLLQKEGNT